MEKPKIYGQLTIVGAPFSVTKNGRTKIVVECYCSCGKTTVAELHKLAIGHTRSCGHLRGVAIAAATRTHGLSSKVPEYAVWKSMRQRCGNAKSKFYFRYGGRGIAIDKSWNDFSVFYADMGSRPTSKHTLERKNNDGPYSQDNCKWAEKIEQASNTSANAHIVFNGESLTIAQWGRKLALSPRLIWDRLHRGWSVHKTFTEPVKPSKRKGRTTHATSLYP